MQDESLPGARLRRAREDKGLSREEVSRELRLSMAYLKALEEDDYGKLPEAPFVKGYLRNYARLLGLPGEELASLFQQQVDRERAHREEHTESEEHKRPVLGPQWRLPVLAGLVVVLVIAVGWWLWPSHEAAPPMADQSPSMQSDSGGQEGGATPDEGIEQSGQPADAAGQDLSAPDSGAMGEQSGTAGTVSGDQAGQGAPVSGEASSAGTAPAQAPRATAPAGEAPESRPAAAQGDSLAMKFSRVCWIKVVDNDGKTLTEGRQEAGSAVDVDGKAPFRVTIGDAGAVSSVVINGEPATLPSQRSGDVIHVTLPR